MAGWRPTGGGESARTEAELRRAVRLLDVDPAAAAQIAAAAARYDRGSAAAFALAGLARYLSGRIDRVVVSFLDKAVAAAAVSPNRFADQWIGRLSTAVEAAPSTHLGVRAADWLLAGGGRSRGVSGLGEDTAWLTFLGDVDCGAELLVLGGGADLPRVHPVARVAWYSVLAAAETSATAATRWAGHAQRAVSTIAADLGRPLRAGHAHLAWAHARQGGQPTEAAGWAVMAADAFQAAGDPLTAAWAHVNAAVALGAAGRRERAGAERCRARELVATHSSALVPLLFRRATHTFKRKLVRVERAPTQRETAVLGLLADGLTATAIARRLGISPRTVHHHLESLYRKLGTSDRLATVRHAEAIGLL